MTIWLYLKVEEEGMSFREGDIEMKADIGMKKTVDFEDGRGHETWNDRSF